mmetsp:Transcript_54068/g.160335  ORF Transcript_54068/g.160335 Transcript_54068/m.160335 type:complete len:224 (+) Transcript_54068:535-1206(+)
MASTAAVSETSNWRAFCLSRGAADEAISACACCSSCASGRRSSRVSSSASCSRALSLSTSYSSDGYVACACTPSSFCSSLMASRSAFSASVRSTDGSKSVATRARASSISSSVAACSRGCLVASRCTVSSSSRTCRLSAARRLSSRSALNLSWSCVGRRATYDGRVSFCGSNSTTSVAASCASFMRARSRSSDWRRSSPGSTGAMSALHASDDGTCFRSSSRT